MANQITIDIGAAANDGTGDPLRTAFNYVNNNFSNVWNTGLPNSNVQFSDNRILTVNTNANLVLSPNGIGKVASNVDIVPNTANVFGLGSPTRRWNTVYGQYLDLSHNATIGGNLVVTGNLSAGNISYTSNVFVGDLEGSVFDGASSIVLDVIDSAIYVDNYRYANGVPVTFGGTPGGSNTQIQFNNAGSFGGSAAFTFNRTSNTLSVSGNIEAGNVFVTSTITSDECYIDNGTFTGDPNTGSGSLYVGSPTFTVLGTDIMAQFTGNVLGYGQLNLQNYSNSVVASGDYIITADNGNDTSHFLDIGMTSSTWDGSETNVLDGLTPNNGYLYVQDGNLTLGTRNGNTSYTWNFDTSGNLSIPGTITTNNAELTLTVGISEWVFDATGVLTIPGEIDTVGNISAGYFLGNGSQLTGIVSSYGNANVATYLPTYTGNVGAGNVIFADNYVYSGNTFTSPETNGILKNFKWKFSDTASGTDTVTLQWNLLDTTFPQWYLTTNSQGNTYVFDGDAKTLGFLDNSVNSGTLTFGTAANNGAGSSNDIELTTVTGNAYVRTGSNSWKFDNTGVLTAPGNITTTGNITGGNVFADTNVYVAATNGNLVLGDATATASPGLSSTSSITVTANRAGTPKEWVFTTVGNFVGSGNISGGNISATGNIATSWLDIGNIGNIASLQADVSLQIVANASGSAPYWTFNSDGNLYVPGSINGDNNGPLLIDGNGSGTEGYISLPASNFGGEQIAIVNQFSLGNGIRLQTNGGNLFFSDAGELSVPSNITTTGNISGNTAGYAIGYRDIPQVSFAGDTTIATTDAGKHYYSVLSTGNVLTIANNASQGFQVGAAITVVNQGSGTITIAQGSDVTLYMAGNATASNRSISTFGMATIMKVATNTWFINGTGVS